jgi:hypothetical protein
LGDLIGIGPRVIVVVYGIVLSGHGHGPDVGSRVLVVVAILSALAVPGRMTWFATSEAEIVPAAVVTFLFCEFGEGGLIDLYGVNVHGIGVWSSVSGLEGSILEEADGEVVIFQGFEFHCEVQCVEFKQIVLCIFVSFQFLFQ